ncbi:hypothetical protein ACFVIM_29695 [Streptomyces sp. NPDC057638]
MARTTRPGRALGLLAVLAVLVADGREARSDALPGWEVRESRDPAPG